MLYVSKIDNLLSEIEAVGFEEGVKIPYRNKILEVVGMCVQSENVHKLFNDLIEIAVKNGIIVDV